MITYEIDWPMLLAFASLTGTLFLGFLLFLQGRGSFPASALNDWIVQAEPVVKQTPTITDDVLLEIVKGLRDLRESMEVMSNQLPLTTILDTLEIDDGTPAQEVDARVGGAPH